MIGIIVALTLRQLGGRGRTILMALLALLPIGLAAVYRASDSGSDPEEWVAHVLLEVFVVTTLLPLVALVYGTAALGAEIEDGTAVYLLSKPIPRSRIIVGKLLAAWLLTTATVLASALIAGAVGLGGLGGAGILPGFALAILLGSLVYSALFVMLSTRTSRALIAGLVYVFIWEGLINGLFAGTRLLSVRHYTLAIADLVVDLPRSMFEAPLGAVTAIVMMLIVGIASIWYAIRRLEKFEIGDTT